MSEQPGDPVKSAGDDLAEALALRNQDPFVEPAVEKARDTKTKRKIKRKLADLTNDDKDFLILYCESQWFTFGRLPSMATIAEEADVSEEVLNQWFVLPEIREALIKRGIRNPLNTYSVGLPVEEGGETTFVEITTSKDQKKSLTELQFVAINVMLDFRDNRSQKKKLADYGISTQQWEGWLNDPVFQDYLQKRGEAILSNNQHEAHLALIDRVRSGDMSAIKYFNQMTGRFTEHMPGDAFNPQYVIMRVIEIITKRVTDPALQQEIAEDLLMLANETNPGQITSGRVVA